MNTVSRAQWEEAQELWRAGEFSDEWRSWRHEAAMKAGIVYPPIGTKWDGWDEDEPTQRAVLIRAIRETPTLLHEAILKTGRSGRTRSWATVIEFLFEGRIEMREELNRRVRLELDDDDRPSHHEAVQTIAAILGRINDAR